MIAPRNGGRVEILMRVNEIEGRVRKDDALPRMEGEQSGIPIIGFDGGIDRGCNPCHTGRAFLRNRDFIEVRELDGENLDFDILLIFFGECGEHIGMVIVRMGEHPHGNDRFYMRRRFMIHKKLIEFFHVVCIARPAVHKDVATVRKLDDIAHAGRAVWRTFVRAFSAELRERRRYEFFITACFKRGKIALLPENDL